MNSMRPIAIVGATGLVGRHLVSRWKSYRSEWPNHLVGSPNSVGMAYPHVWNTKENQLVTHYGSWWQPLAVPNDLPDYRVESIDAITPNAIVLSTVPERAGPDEDKLVAKGCLVISNSPYRRTDPRIPLWVPGVGQAPTHPYIKIPNCVTIGITLALAPVIDWIEGATVSISTYQSLSGRGDAMYPQPLPDHNVFPLRHSDENTEIHILSELERLLPSCRASISCYRIPTQVGHLIDIAIHHPQNHQINDWVDRFQSADLVVGPDGRPQSRHDAETYGGMTPVVGNILYHQKTDTIRLTVVINNLIRGAAGSLMLALNHVNPESK